MSDAPISALVIEFVSDGLLAPGGWRAIVGVSNIFFLAAAGAPLSRLS